MITIEEIEKKYLKSDSVCNFNKILYKLLITKISEAKVSSLNPNDITVFMKFNFWNPITYVYMFLTLVCSLPIYLYDGGLKGMYMVGKDEIVNGFKEYL